ncbi:MAG: L,D-transpeptidase family protein [Sphingobium sp.]|nr:L,D-transpeptidase family protein [Sphingobium sp.]
MLACAPAAGLSAQGPAEAEAPTGRNAVAAQIKEQVGGRLRDIYAPRGYWPLWIEDGAVGKQADALLALIDSAALDGLDPDDYDPGALRRAVEAASDGTPRSLARAELALSKAFVALAGDMRRPSRDVPMRYLDEELDPRKSNPADLLRAAALAPSFARYVAQVGWMSPLYMRLRQARAGYDESWGRLPDIGVADDVKLRPGMRGVEVEALRHRLGLEPDGGYDRALAARVRAFQADHGLDADGIAGAQTIAALNRGPAWFTHVLDLNMARARLLPGPWVRHVVVDAASARLFYYDRGALDGTMKVVVGAKESQTPMMAGMVRYATLNPYWNIPTDLVQKSVAPKILRGQSLKALRYEALSDWSANARPLAQSEVDWSAVAAGASEVRVRQLPGGNNAMGRVKFMFPNDLGIYLHDTPARDLLAKEARQFSNGCVRLEDAARLGRWFFGKPLGTGSGAPERHEPLPAPVPVYLTYLTAVPQGDGIRFLPDPYGRDGE